MRPNGQGAEPLPKAGDVLLIGEDASVQFAGQRFLIFRVVKIDNRTTCHGWVWLRGYVLDGRSQAVERREIFVQHKGLKPAPVPYPSRPWDRGQVG